MGHDWAGEVDEEHKKGKAVELRPNSEELAVTRAGEAAGQRKKEVSPIQNTNTPRATSGLV